MDLLADLNLAATGRCAECGCALAPGVVLCSFCEEVLGSLEPVAAAAAPAPPATWRELRPLPESVISLPARYVLPVEVANE